MLIIKLKVTDLDKEHFFKGKTGTFCDLVVFENDVPDKYGNTHVVYQGVSKEARDAGKKGKIVGNGTEKGRTKPTKTVDNYKAPTTPDIDAMDNKSDIPF